MTYPPLVPPATRTDSTASARTHAADHNTIAVALASILAELGPNPSGPDESLTARLAALAVPDVSADLAAAISAHTAATDPHGDRAFTTAAVSAAINALVASAPGTLDTLGEIAAQLAADESAVAALTVAINAKVSPADLAAALTGKAETGHTHTIGQVTDLAATLAGKADITALPNALETLRPTYLPAAPVTRMVAQAHTAGHGWASAGAGTFNLNDTSAQAVLGAQAAKVTTNGTGGIATLTKAGLTLDLTGQNPVLWLLVDDPSRINYITLQLGNAGLSSYYSWTFERNFSPVGFAGVPYKLTLPFGSAAIVGAPSRSAIVDARVSVTDKAGGPVNVWLGGVGAQADAPYGKGGVAVFTFDDGYASQMSAQRILDRYGFRSTYYPIVDLVGQATYFTLAQYKALQAAGNEVACHAATVAAHNAAGGFTALTAAQLEAEYATLKRWAVINGFTGRDHLAYPQGLHNAAVVDTTAKFFTTARTTNVATPETLPPANPLRIRTRMLDNLITLAEAKAAVDVAKASNSVIVFTSHKLGAAADDLTWTTADFTALVDYVAAQALQVRTMSDALSGISTGTALPPPPTGPSVLFSDSFTGADGAALSASWAVTTNGAAGAGVVINTNRARLKSGATGGYAYADRAVFSTVANLGPNLDVTASLTWADTNEAYPYLFVRSSTQDVQNGDGYMLAINRANWSLSKYVTGAKAVIGALTNYSTYGVATPAVNVKLWVRIAVVGSTINMKVWNDGQAEPGAWTRTITDPAIAGAGKVGFGIDGGNGTTSTSVYVDDVNVLSA